MRYIFIFISLNILGFISFVKTQKKCNSHSQISQCNADSQCKWINDKTKDQCKNILSNCDSLSSERQKCESNLSCEFFQGQVGFCNQKASLECPQTKEECQKEQKKNRCVWIPTQECEDKKDGIECSQLKTEGECKLEQNKNRCIWTSTKKCEDKKCSELTEEDCYLNYDFCTAAYNCEDIGREKCKSFSEQKCKDAGEYCEKKDKKEKKEDECTQKQGFCEKLNPDECQLNSKFCNFEQQTPQACVDKKDQSVCAQKKSVEDCNFSSKYCYMIEKPCIFGDIDCSKIQNEECVEFQSYFCSFNQDTQKCEQIVDCLQLNADQCLENKLRCFAKQICSNKDSFECSLLNSVECKSNSQYCTLTPATGNCTSRQGSCKDFNGYNCQYYKNECSYKPAEYECDIKANMSCTQNNNLDCLNLPYCKATFKQCDIKESVCSTFNSNECNKDLCNISDKGYCSDEIINCPTNKTDCLNNQDCEWIGEIPDQCVQYQGCPFQSSDKCQSNKFKDICDYVQGGICIAQDELTEESSNHLFFSSFFIFLIYFISLM